MAQNTKTIVKIFLLFFAYQLCINIFISTMPLIVNDQSQENTDYLEYIDSQVNTFFDSTSTGNSLINSMKESISKEDLFNDSIISSFLGVLKIIGSIIKFIVQLALSMLFIPGSMINILLYNFIANTSYTASLSILVNISFYLTMYYIIFKARTSS